MSGATPQPKPAPAELATQRAHFLGVAEANLALRWANTTPTNLGDESLAVSAEADFNRAPVIPDLSGDSFAYAPGFEQFGPASGTVTIGEKAFTQMFPQGRLADIGFIANARPARPTADNDALWGIVNSPNILALLWAVHHVRPQNALVIGGGIGLVEALMAQAMPKGSVLTVVDAGSAETRYPITPHGQTYRRPLEDGNLFRFLKSAESQGLVGPASEHAEVECIESDSQAFLDRERADGRNKFDLILVDGNHAYLNGTLDILKSFSLLRQGGVLMVDDWTRLFHSQGVVHGMGLLAYEAGVQVYSLEARGNTDLVDAVGNPPNMVFAVRSPNASRPVDSRALSEIASIVEEITRGR